MKKCFSKIALRHYFNNNGVYLMDSDIVFSNFRVCFSIEKI